MKQEVLLERKRIVYNDRGVNSPERHRGSKFVHNQNITSKLIKQNKSYRTKRRNRENHKKWGSLTYLSLWGGQ